MIPWWWMIPAVFVGAIMGVIVVALCIAGSEKDKD